MKESPQGRGQDEEEAGPKGSPIPESVGPYEVLAELERDETGSLYRVRDSKQEGELLLRAMSPRWTLSEGAKARFVGVAKTQRAAVHGGILAVLDIGESEGLPWFTMPETRAMSLLHILHALDEQEISPRQAGARSVGEILVGRRVDAEFEETWSGDWYDLIADIAMQAARALQHAHRQGLFHGDLGPSTILLGPDGRVKLCDFGLARIEARQVHQATGRFVGVPLYLSPEQVRWEDESPASEIWALGVLLYRLGTGRLPFPGATPERVFAAILGKDPKLPWKQNPHFPKELGKITMQCLRKDPAARYATMEDLAQDLERFLDEQPVQARLPGPLARGLGWALTHPLQALPAALLAVILVAVIGFATVGSPSEERGVREASGGEELRQAESVAGASLAAKKRRATSLAEAIADLIKRARRPRGRMRILFVGIQDECGYGRAQTASLVEQLQFPGYVELIRPRQARKFLALAGLEAEDLATPAGLATLTRSMGMEFHAVLSASVTRDERGRAELHFGLRDVTSNQLDKESLYLDGKARSREGLEVKITSALQALHDASPGLENRASLAFLGFEGGTLRLMAHANQVLEKQLIAYQPRQLLGARATQRAIHLAHLSPDRVTTRNGGMALSQALGLRLDYILSGRLDAVGDRVVLRLYRASTGKPIATFDSAEIK